MSIKAPIIFVAMSFAMLGIGCDNACDDAAEKLEECGVGDISAVDTDKCNDHDECAADCIKDADCGDIDALFGASDDSSSASDVTNSKLLLCMSKCQ